MIAAARPAPFLDTDVLPGPYRQRTGPELKATPEVRNLALAQVSGLLQASPSFHRLAETEQERMRDDLAKIATYSAALVLDQWQQADKLDQTPVVIEQTTIEGEPSQSASVPTRSFEDSPAAAEFAPRAANNVARITEDTLNAISFPAFVADLIQGTFQAIVDASIQQMEAFGALLANVAKTVDEFMADNISDNMARDWLVEAYPQNFKLQSTDEGAKAVSREEISEEQEGAIRRGLGVPEGDLDGDAVEERLVPAARRKVAQNRQQLLSSMVLMGINRIVVTTGRIKAEMGFRIDTKDQAKASASQQFDFKNETSARYGSFFSPIKAKTKTTVAYVSSSEKNSENEIDVRANLTGAVDLRFKSETFPLERFADAGVISSIQGNTANPAGNQPMTGNSAQEG